MVEQLCRNWQRFRKMTTKIVLDKDGNLLWSSGLQWHWSSPNNETTPLPILLTDIFLGTGNFPSNIWVTRAFPTNGFLDVSEVWVKCIRAFWRYFGMKYLWLDIQYSAVIFRKRSDFEIQFYLIVLSFTFISRDHENGFSRSQEIGIW